MNPSIHFVPFLFQSSEQYKINLLSDEEKEPRLKIVKKFSSSC
jgi:hypothetical protein